MNERSLRIAIFWIQIITLAVLLVHLFAAWQYKLKWQDLNSRVEKLEQVK